MNTGKTKTNEIIGKLSDILASTDDNYLHTSYLVVFLLIGCPDETKVMFEKRAREIIADRKAIVILQASSAVDVVADIRTALDDVGRSGVGVRNLTRLHFCPFIFAENADPSCYKPIVDKIEAYKTSHELEVIWKPFIILDPANANSSVWLDGLAEVITGLASTGVASCCRLCVMTERNEDGFVLHMGRLLDTVLFTALLHANAETQESIGRLVAYWQSYPEDVFYTAQTVFISNPVIMRTLRCMHRILEQFFTEKTIETELELGFIWRALWPIYEKLPKENNRISFTPLYGVMPNSDGNRAHFRERLTNFAEKYYLSGFVNNKPELFREFRIGFLHAFIKSGKSDEYLQGLIGNSWEIDRLSNIGTPFQMSGLEAISSKSGMDRDDLDDYQNLSKFLSNKLNSISSDLLREFFRSEGFDSLPKLYIDAKKRIKEISTELNDEVKRRELRSGDEIYLELSGDPDEVLVRDALKALQDSQVFSKFITDITLCLEANDEAGADAAIEGLVNSIFEQVKGLSGGGGATEYMNLFLATFRDPNSDTARKCLEAIAKHFKFPVRFESRGERKRTFLLGGEEEDNNFYRAWEGMQTMFDTNTENLKIKSKKSIVLLTVSSAFKRSDIVGIT